MQATSQNKTNGYVRFTPNEPQTLTLKSFQFRESTTPWNGDLQHVYRMSDGRPLFLPLEVSERVQAKCYAGVPFTIEKRRVNGDYQWIVESSRKPEPAKPQPVAQLLETAEIEEYVAPAGTPETQLEYALKAAVAAAASAEKHGDLIGYGVRFTPSDIRAMGISVLIGMSQNQRMAGVR